MSTAILGNSYLDFQLSAASQCKLSGAGSILTLSGVAGADVELKGLADGTTDASAVTKRQLDSLSQGIKWKESVVVLVTTNVDLASPGATLDGVTMTNGDRVLLDGQTTTSQDGIYVWNGATSNMTRALDFAAGSSVASCAVFVEEGSYADSGWVVSNNTGSDVVATDDINWVRFSGLSDVVAGDGLAKTGNTLDVNVGQGLEISSDNVQIQNLAVVAGMLAADSVITSKIQDNAVTTGKVADFQITEAKLANDSVTTIKILDASVTTVKILDANVTNAKLASDSVSTIKILDSNVTTAKIADANITTAKILDANVTNAKLASDSVTTAKILDANVTADKLASNSVTTLKILDSNVTNDKIADGTIQNVKLANSSLTVNTSDGVSGGSAVSLGGSVSLTVDSTVIRTTGAQSMAGVKTFSDTTQATSSTAAGTVFSGGLGIAKDVRCDGTIYASSHISTSDKRLKTNIEPISDTDISQLNPVYFKWRDGRDEYKHAGLLAQETRELFPDAVREDGNAYLSVDYSHIFILMLKEVQRLRAEVDELKAAK